MNLRIPAGKNSFNHFEIAGAFGDLGTLVPFLAAYFSILHLAPSGILFVFGVANIMVGIWYKTPVPVQPMKAIGAAAVASPGAFGAGELLGASLVTGIFWFVAGIGGLAEWLKGIAEKPVVRGIIFGLGMTFVTTGIKMMQTTWWLGLAGIVITFALLQNKKIPAIFILLLLGFVFSFIWESGRAQEFLAIRPQFNLPAFSVSEITWQGILAGGLFLALPQIPLTLGNGIIALESENNKLFPDRKTNVKKIALTTSIMNLMTAFLGGVPMCHGAGGMVGHVRFGAHTGGSTIILGVFMVVLALFFGNSVTVLFAMLPLAILGVILLFTGIELCFGARDIGAEAEDFYIFVVVAGLSLWNIGAAFFVGLLMAYMMKKEFIRL